MCMKETSGQYARAVGQAAESKHSKDLIGKAKIIYGLYIEEAIQLTKEPPTLLDLVILSEKMAYLVCVIAGHGSQLYRQIRCYDMQTLQNEPDEKHYSILLLLGVVGTHQGNTGHQVQLVFRADVFNFIMFNFLPYRKLVLEAERFEIGEPGSDTFLLMTGGKDIRGGLKEVNTKDLKRKS